MGSWCARHLPVLENSGVCCGLFRFSKEIGLSRNYFPGPNVMTMLGIGPEFAVSPDEHEFLYGAVERNESDLMLLENFP
jgi:hypothetical protein